MKRHVALIVETSSGYGRKLLAGIVRYLRTCDGWSVFLEQRDLMQKPPAWLESWRGAGIISRVTTAELMAAISANGVPFVELTDRDEDSEYPHVRSDDHAIGRLAADHLLERGFRRFGFCGFQGEAWSQRRQTAFVDAIRAAGFECRVYTTPWHGPEALPWDDQQKALGQWLAEFSKPVGIMACNDLRGQHVLEACSDLQLAVPEEVAVIGVDDDQLLCQLCSPPLSSVIPNAERVGYLAAAMLDKLMNREQLAKSREVVAPLGIATRQSTDIVAIDDAEIAAALHLIREQACRGLTVQEVVDHCDVSRSTLERQFRKLLGRTPQQEIRNVQIKRVCELLATTDLAMERIAPLCGFEHTEYLHVVFKRMMRVTPGDYRRSAQPGLK